MSSPGLVARCSAAPVFVGDLSVDLLVDAPGQAGGEPSFARLDVPPDEWLRQIAALTGDRDCDAHPGGSIANVAAAFASGHDRPPAAQFTVTDQATLGRLRPPLWWPGYDVSLVDLCARGLRVVGHDPAPAGVPLPGSLAVIGEGGAIVRLVVNSQRPRPLVRPAGSLIVLRSDHVELAGLDYVESFGSAAILLSDDGLGWAALLGSPVCDRRWIFGSRRQVEEFVRAVPPDALAGTQLIGTDAKRPCLVLDQQGAHELPVPAADRVVTELGAGDAYMGGFLARAAAGGDITACHAQGCAAAAAALASRGARPALPDDLNTVFPDIDRSSPHRHEGRLVDVVRRSPGVALVTGGQTGVESVAAECGAEAGLPTHVIFPNGRRREDGPLPPEQAARWGRARLHELGSPSFRYRTWATVYLADAVVLVDPAGGEGSAETRAAAAFHNRPLWDVTERGHEQVAIAGWLAAIGPRAVLVAGNRASLLAAAGATGTAAAAVADVVAALCQVNASYLRAPDLGAWQAAGPCWPRPWGVPPSAVAWLRGSGMAEVMPDEPVVLPPRDLVTALRRGELRMILTWPSLMSDEVRRDCQAIPLGCFPIHYGLLSADRSWPARPRVAVQYADAFARHTELPEPVATFPITGRAETWVSADLADMAYDSFRTGATAAGFGDLRFFPSHWESLCLVWRSADA